MLAKNTRIVMRPNTGTHALCVGILVQRTKVGSIWWEVEFNGQITTVCEKDFISVTSLQAQLPFTPKTVTRPNQPGAAFTRKLIDVLWACALMEYHDIISDMNGVGAITHLNGEVAEEQCVWNNSGQVTLLRRMGKRNPVLDFPTVEERWEYDFQHRLVAYGLYGKPTADTDTMISGCQYEYPPGRSDEMYTISFLLWGVVYKVETYEERVGIAAN